MENNLDIMTYELYQTYRCFFFTRKQYKFNIHLNMENFPINI